MKYFNKVLKPLVEFLVKRIIYLYHSFNPLFWFMYVIVKENNSNMFTLISESIEVNLEELFNRSSEWTLYNTQSKVIFIYVHPTSIIPSTSYGNL